jgi:hypothetical protein
VDHAADRADLGAGRLQDRADGEGVADVHRVVDRPAPAASIRRRLARDLAVGHELAEPFAEGLGRGDAVEPGEQLALDLGLVAQGREPGGLRDGRRAAAQHHERRPERPGPGRRRPRR